MLWFVEEILLVPLVVEFCSFVHIVSLLNFKLPWLFRCIYFYLFYQEHTARLNKSSKFRNILKNTCLSVLSREKSIRKKIRETFSVVFFSPTFLHFILSISTFSHVFYVFPRGKINWLHVEIDRSCDDLHEAEKDCAKTS